MDSNGGGRTCVLCGRKHYAHGYCARHYQNFRRTGSPLGSQMDWLVARLDKLDGAVELLKKKTMVDGECVVCHWTGGNHLDDCVVGEIARIVAELRE